MRVIYGPSTSGLHVSPFVSRCVSLMCAVCYLLRNNCFPPPDLYRLFSSIFICFYYYFLLFPLHAHDNDNKLQKNKSEIKITKTTTSPQRAKWKCRGKEKFSAPWRRAKLSASWPFSTTVNEQPPLKVNIAELLLFIYFQRLLSNVNVFFLFFWNNSCHWLQIMGHRAPSVSDDHDADWADSTGRVHRLPQKVLCFCLLLVSSLFFFTKMVLPDSI